MGPLWRAGGRASRRDSLAHTHTRSTRARGSPRRGRCAEGRRRRGRRARAAALCPGAAPPGRAWHRAGRRTRPRASEGSQRRGARDGGGRPTTSRRVRSLSGRGSGIQPKWGDHTERSKLWGLDTGSGQNRDPKSAGRSRPIPGQSWSRNSVGHTIRPKLGKVHAEVADGGRACPLNPGTTETREFHRSRPCSDPIRPNAARISFGPKQTEKLRGYVRNVI